MRRALENACPLSEVRRIFEDETETFSNSALLAFRASGAGFAPLTVDYGGLGLGFLELCVAAEELGRALAPTPVGSSLYLAAPALQDSKSEALKQEILPKLATVEVSGTLALAESPSWRIGDPIATQLHNGRVYGRKTLVPHGSHADFAIVLVNEENTTDPQTGLAYVDLKSCFVEKRNLSSVDPTLPVAELVLDGCGAEKLEYDCSADVALSRLLDKSAVLYAFEQVGGAGRALELGRDYAMDRRAFGRTIGSYQAIKHKLADVYAMIEIARAHAYYGAWALTTAAQDLPRAAAAARLAATNAFIAASSVSLHVHGGFGFTWESDCHLFYRRARHLASCIGSTLDWENRLLTALYHEEEVN